MIRLAIWIIISIALISFDLGIGIAWVMGSMFWEFAMTNRRDLKEGEKEE